MQDFFMWFVQQTYSIVDVLQEPSFNIAGVDVTFFDLILGCIVISFFIGFLWKGVKG